MPLNDISIFHCLNIDLKRKENKMFGRCLHTKLKCFFESFFLPLNQCMMGVDTFTQRH